MRFEVSGDGESITGVVEGISTLAPSIDDQLGVMTFKLGPLGSFEIRQIGADVYLAAKGELRSGLGLPSGAEWIHVNINDVVAENPALQGLIAQQEQYDATQYLAYLEEISSRVEEIGSSEVRGVAATQYRAQLDLREYFDQILGQSGFSALSSAERRIVRQILEAFSEVEADVWVDDSGRLVRMEMTFDFGDLDIPDAPGDFKMILSMDMFDFDVPVEVEPPPPEDVVESEEFPGLAA
jgi:hypothetical protein